MTLETTNSPAQTPVQSSAQVSALAQAFTAHPASVGETYLQHMGAAFGFAGLLLRLAVCAALHGLVPAWHERTVSDRILRLAAEMSARRDGKNTQKPA